MRPAGRIVSWLVRLGQDRPRPVLLLAALAVVAAGLALTRLDADTGASTLLGSGSPSFEATQRAEDRFGSDPVIVRIDGDVSRLVLTPDLTRVLGLEGCLAGKQTRFKDGPCARLAALQPAQAVIGPGTFINTSASQIAAEYERQVAAAKKKADRAARAAAELGRARGLPPDQIRQVAQAASDAVQRQSLLELAQLGLRFGILKPPTINDQNFVSQLVFAGGKEAGTPKARFAYLFPNKETSLVSVRLRAGLSESERRAAIADIRAATAMKEWRLLNGGRYAVTGAPVVLADLTDSVVDALLTLSLIALLVMALTLAIVFPVRRRLAPLVVAVGAATITFGLLSAVGASLTIAAVAVAPILLGLVVDYALQLQSQIAGRRDGPQSLDDGTGPGGPVTIAIASVTTAAGFTVLALSPVPMVREFGLLLVAGVLIGLLAALAVVPALLTVAPRTPTLLARAGALLAPAGRGAAQILAESRIWALCRRAGRRAADRATAAAQARPRRLLLAGAAIAALGLLAGTQAEVESDVVKLAPQRLTSIKELKGLQQSTGVGGQIDLLIEGRRVTEPKVVRWMSDYQRRILKRFGYSDKRGCGEADLCPAFSLPDLLSGFKNPTRKQIEGLLEVIPPSFSQSVITSDRRSATVAFGIRLMSLERQSEVIEQLRKELDPPKGVEASLVGLPVVAADANAAISSPLRRMLTLLGGLLIVGFVLRLLLGSWRRSLVPLIPIVLAAGWAPLLLLITGVPLNAMSVTLSALVVAIATEFSVLLSERQRREREAGRSFTESIAAMYDSTGKAVLASGVTAIAGFAVLVISDIRMLRDFGLVTVIDLTVALAAVLLTLPAALALFDGAGDE